MRDAMESVFSRAVRVTFVGSMAPAFTMFLYLNGTAARDRPGGVKKPVHNAATRELRLSIHAPCL
jgi:hypothetical protein